MSMMTMMMMMKHIQLTRCHNKSGNNKLNNKKHHNNDEVTTIRRDMRHRFNSFGAGFHAIN